MAGRLQGYPLGGLATSIEPQARQPLLAAQEEALGLRSGLPGWP